MPVERYRDVAEMPRPPRLQGEKLVAAIAAVWERAHARLGACAPRGVTKFRSLEEAQQARRLHTRATLRRLRGASEG